MTSKQRWGTRLGLVLAMAGNAVGLGNFLRFPAQAAKNGGGAFLIPYIVALLIVGLPLMWVEWTMGRYAGQLGHHSAPGILQAMGRSRLWKYFGVFGLWTNLVVNAYYLYIESWTMGYAGFSLVGGFQGKSPDDVKRFFNDLIGEQALSVISVSGSGMVLFFACIAINVFILSRGLSKGIEFVAKIGMPLLIVFAAILAIRGMMIVPAQPVADGVVNASAEQKEANQSHEAIEWPSKGLNYVWEPNLDKLTDPSVWLAAAGQIFFTLGIGFGSIHCYASYLRRNDDVTLNGATTAWTNEFCEVVLGGTILIPIATAYLGLAAVQEYTRGGSGFGLGFNVFPTLFNNWGWFGPVAGFMWFGLLFFAAITSSLAMGQPILAFFQDEFGMSLKRSALYFGALLLPLSTMVAIFHQGTFFDEFDFWAGTFSIVLFGVVESFLFAWIFGMDRGWAEMMRGAEMHVPRLFYFVIKYVTPIFLLVIMLGFAFKPEGKITETDLATGQQVEQNAGWEPYVNQFFGGQPAPAWVWADDGLVGKLLHKDLPLKEGASAEETSFNSAMKRLRTIDRLVMVGVFALFAVLVYWAWQRRAAEGRVEQ